ncbi:hypothetical protein [Stenotrophomonas maltophilia]|uniref:hypothetical protein n=1 Tax=Stenotrophomonas maltophilia TaxID=40324 RepID=UPI000AF4DA00|nr:hypothetical protein [Stenotrophomonas maltophilia]
MKTKGRIALSIALQIKGLLLLAPACMEIWQGVTFPSDALAASLLMLTGLWAEKIEKTD